MHSHPVGSSTRTPRSRPGFRPLLPVVFLWLTLTLNAAADPLDHWIWRSPQPFGVSVFSVLHGNGLWLAVANTGLVATSPDGTSWDLASIGTNGAVSACAYGTN